MRPSTNRPSRIQARNGASPARRERRGVTLVLVALMFMVILGFSALALDAARMYSFNAQLKTLSDAAAMSAVLDLTNGVSKGQAETNAIALASLNHVDGRGVATIAASDITGVSWNFTTRASGAAGSWNAANAVQVTVHYTASWSLARVFGGSNTKVLNQSTIAAGGSLSTSNCLKPFAIPYAALLAKLSYSSPYPMGHDLTNAEVALLDDVTSAIKLTDNDTPGAGAPGNFGWVDVNTTNIGNKNQEIAAAMTGCVSSGLGVGSTLDGITGVRNAKVVRDAIDVMCGGTSNNGTGTCDATYDPILVPIYDSGTGTGNNATFHVKYVGAFKLTRVDSDGLWGYLTSLHVDPSGTLSSSPGPVAATVIVR
jgi:hypothetical protein